MPAPWSMVKGLVGDQALMVEVGRLELPYLACLGSRA
jgi:hypothetical protein